MWKIDLLVWFLVDMNEVEMNGSWSVVTTAKESSVLISSFVSHHLSLGAGAIYLYLDDAREDQYEMFSSHPKVNVFMCDQLYWEKKSMERPQDHRRRQVVNANHALNICQTEWICHIDVDEYLMPPSSISEILSECTDQVLRVRPAENFFSKRPETIRDLLTSSFHLPFPKYRAGRKYRQEIGKWCEACPGGLQGHIIGKVFLRKDSGLKLNIHEARPRSEKVSKVESDIRLLHFFSLGYSDWLSKNFRRIYPSRLAGVSKWKRRKLDLFYEALKNSNRDDSLLWLFEDAMVYSGEKKDKLEKYAGIIDNELFLEEKVKDCFGEREELSFDQPLSYIKKDVDVNEEMYKIALSSIEEFI